MGFSLSLPIPGQPFASEGVKVGNDLSTISTWANGNIAGTDLAAAAAIARSQMAGGFGNLAATSVGVNTSVVDGKFYIVTAGTTTMTLPSPTANATVGVFASAGQTGAAPTTVARSSGVINGLGVAGATSIVLGAVGAFVVLLADGTNWNIVSGQQDTGWIAVGLGTGMSAAASRYTPSARLQADIVRLKGQISQAGSGNAQTALATIPAASMFPTQTVQLPYVFFPFAGTFFTVSTGGAVTINTSTAGGTDSFPLDGLTYSIS